MFHAPLFVPGDRPTMLEKAARRGSDLVVIDLEDAVPLASKAAARDTVAAAVRRLRAEGQPTAVRVNSVVEERDADLAALDGVEMDALVVPKATVAGVEEVAAATAAVPLVALIESGEGVLEAPAIASHARIIHLAAGEADLAADLDMEAGDEDPAWLPSRMRLVWASAAAGIGGPIGPVYVDLSDLDGLRASTSRLAAMGFSGRLAIHPGQVPVISDVFTPSEEDLAEARRYVAAFDAAVAEGRGVIVDESGAIVDEALVRRARRLIGE